MNTRQKTLASQKTSDTHPLTSGGLTTEVGESASNSSGSNSRRKRTIVVTPPSPSQIQRAVNNVTNASSDSSSPTPKRQRQMSNISPHNESGDSRGALRNEMTLSTPTIEEDNSETDGIPDHVTIESSTENNDTNVVSPVVHNDNPVQQNVDDEEEEDETSNLSIALLLDVEIGIGSVVLFTRRFELSNATADNLESIFEIFHSLIEGDDRGMTETEINELAIILVSEDDMQDSILNEPEQCSICRDNIVLNDELRVIPCIHRFHKQCIDQWLLNSANCPVCRRNVQV